VIEAPNVDVLAIAPEISLLVGASLVLMVAAFLRGRDRGIGVVLGIAAFAVSAGFAIAAWDDPPAVTIAEALQVDQLTQAVRILVAGCGILTLLVALGWPRMREAGAEYAAILLFAATGMTLIAGSNSFVTLFVALELFSISLYVLCAFDRSSKASLESGFKYLVLGTIGSIILVYGAAFLYGATGSFQFDGVAAGLAEAEPGAWLVVLGVVLVLAGLLFKIGALPFHMWVPDVYEGAPTSVSGFMAAATKIAAFVALARVMAEPLAPVRDTWEPVLVAVAVATIVVGNVAALVQDNVKRMLAYSSIAAAGFGLIAIIVGGEAGSRALLFYLAAYAPMAIGAFAVITLHERDHHGITTLESIRAWGFARPFAALAMVVFLLGFAGFPLTAGFLGKFLVAGSAVASGWAWLAVAGAIGSVIGIAYYLRVILAMYDRSARSGVHAAGAPGLASVSIAIALCLALVIAGGVLPGIGIDWAGEAAKVLAVGR
jgi:NADH-quinone oxidoreductase subunit N